MPFLQLSFCDFKCSSNSRRPSSFWENFYHKRSCWVGRWFPVGGLYLLCVWRSKVGSSLVHLSLSLSLPPSLSRSTHPATPTLTHNSLSPQIGEVCRQKCAQPSHLYTHTRLPKFALTVSPFENASTSPVVFVVKRNGMERQTRSCLQKIDSGPFFWCFLLMSMTSDLTDFTSTNMPSALIQMHTYVFLLRRNPT